MRTVPCDNCENQGWLRLPIDFRGPDGPAHIWCPKCNESRQDFDERMIRENWKLRRLEKALRAVVECEDYEAGYIAHHGDCNINYAKSENPPCSCDVRHVTDVLDALSGNVLDDIVAALNEEEDPE